MYVGVYTTADWWSANVSGALGGTIEWTAQVSYSSPSSSDCAYRWQSPDGSTSHVAEFYAGYSQTATCALAWQWISGSADYDQVDGSGLRSAFSSGACN